MTTFGLGWLPSPPDERDFPLAALYAAAGIEPAAVIPDAYTAPDPLPVVFDQGSTPECVAYSSGAMKVYEELRDSGAFTPAFDAFFKAIGGGPKGAYTRNAFDRMLKAGYPPNEALHKIASYYTVPVTRDDIQQAILAFGPVVVGMSWDQAWFSPRLGVLPAPSGISAGGHAILAIGWDARGLHLRNSWGPRWGLGGDCFLPWAYLGAVGEAWKAVDAITTPPAPAFEPRSAVNFTVVNPTRLIDSRTSGGKLAANEPRIVPVTGGIVPVNAVAITGNLTITNPTAAGWATVTPTVGTPTTSAVNFGKGGTVANGFTIGLAPDGSVAVYSIVPADFILDITGYFSA